MAKYLEYFRISFVNILAYRARYYVGILTYIIYIAIYYYIWKAIYANSDPGATINSYSLKQMTTYVAVGWVSRQVFYNNLDRDIEAKVTDGSLAMDLLKPIDFQAMAYSKVFGEALFRFVLFALPTAVVAYFLFDISLPHSGLDTIAFLFSVMIAALIHTNINFIVGSFAIPLKSIEGIAHAKANLMLFLSGLLIPFDMLPATLAGVFKALPFAAITYVPVNIYLGKYAGAELAFQLGIQLAWAVGLLVASRLLWNYFMRGVVIQGG